MVTETAAATVKVRVLVAVVQQRLSKMTVSVAERVTSKVPDCVGVPDSVPSVLDNDRPLGKPVTVQAYFALVLIALEPPVAMTVNGP